MTVDATTNCPHVRLVDGVELLGQYKGSGLREAPFLVRRADGQVVQVSRLIYLVASSLHAGDGDLRKVASQVSAAYEREVTTENVAYLVDRKLAPMGLLRAELPAAGSATDSPDSSLSPAPPRAKPLLALRMRLPLVPERVHRVVTNALVPLFRLPVVIAVLAGLVMLDVWLFTGRSQLELGLRRVIYQPQLLLMVTLLTFAAAAFHEFGHAAAARRGGARPGAMGVGIYLVWPVFYTDVSDAYRLSRRSRLRTDLGGVYFNLIFALGLAGAYALTGFQPLLVSVVLVQIETLRQFLPFVRLDGYYVVSDLAGVPNLFGYMRPVLVGLLRRRDDAPRRAARAKLRELNPTARALIVGWVCLTAPVLLVNLVVLLLVAPRLAGAAWGSAVGQIHAMGDPSGGLDLVRVVNGTIGVTLLAMPVLGIGYILVRSLGRVQAIAAAWWSTRPALTGAMVTGLATAVVLQVALMWPDAFASALRHAEESPEVDAPVQIASPPAPDHDTGVELATTAPEPAPPPALPVDSDDNRRRRRDVDDRDTGEAPSEPSETVPSPEEESASPPADHERGGGGGRNSPRPTTTTTAPQPTTTLPAQLPEEPIAELLEFLFTPPGA